MQRLAGVIFDMDGTLGDTVYVSVEAIVRTAAYFSGKAYTHQEIIDRFGPTEQGILQDLLPQDVWAQSYAYFLTQYETIHQKGSYGLYPGIPAILDLLQAHHVRMAIVTGKGADSAAISLRHFGAAPYFDYMETGFLQGGYKERSMQTILDRWQLPASHTYYVGDAPADVTSARKAGVHPISVAWADSADANQLAAQQPLALFRQPAEFEQWLTARLNGHV